MGINHFTKEQTEKLRSNPYVKHVSEKAITYTEEFREEFYIRYQETVSYTHLDVYKRQHYRAFRKLRMNAMPHEWKEKASSLHPAPVPFE